MSKVKLLALCAVPTLGLVLSVAEAPGSPELPPGSMQTEARTACMTCHDAHIIIQQRLSKAAWGKEVDKMIKWGAILNPSDRDALVDYFSVNFPPDKPAYLAQRSASAKHKL
jgi:hypothetical protein